VEKVDRVWETGCHLSPLALLIGVPVANVIAPLIIWLIRKKTSPSTDMHGRAVLNFQLTMTLYFAILVLLSILEGKVSNLGFLSVPIGIGMRAWAYLNIFYIIRAGYESAQGKLYPYPFSIRFISQ
tara:strand:- start:1295 stop:1672 length:378 start_codon:yes stop_codon:yes gene_type:complete